MDAPMRITDEFRAAVMNVSPKWLPVYFTEADLTCVRRSYPNVSLYVVTFPLQ